MDRLTITIPRYHNNGSMVPVDDINQIQGTLMDLFGGFTRTEVYGQWTDTTGDIYQDKSFRYEVLTGESNTYGELIALAVRYCGILGQKTILTTRETVQAVDFISAT